MEQNLRKPSLYDEDFFGWTLQQADLLRRGQITDADLKNIVEEIETLGRSEQLALESAYRLICMHLLKLLYQPSHASRSWFNTIVRERNTAESVLDASPSLKVKRAALLAKAYRQARKEAAAETSLPLAVFPEQPPFTLGQLHDDDFMPLSLRDTPTGVMIEGRSSDADDH